MKNGAIVAPFFIYSPASGIQAFKLIPVSASTPIWLYIAHAALTMDIAIAAPLPSPRRKSR
jgi:hypothetical protein